MLVKDSRTRNGGLDTAGDAGGVDGTSDGVGGDTGTTGPGPGTGTGPGPGTRTRNRTPKFKRGPYRKKFSDTGPGPGGTGPDFATIDAEPAAKSRRTRPDPGPEIDTNAADTARLALDPEAVSARAGAILAAHMFFPAIRPSPQVAMAMAEAQLRTEAAFGIVVSEKTQAVMLLIGTHAMHYGPAIGALLVANKARNTRPAGPHFGGGGPNQPWQGPQPVPPASSGPEPTPHTAGGAPPSTVTDGAAVISLHGRTDRPLDYGSGAD